MMLFGLIKKDILIVKKYVLIMLAAAYENGNREFEFSFQGFSVTCIWNYFSAFLHCFDDISYVVDEVLL